MQYDYKKIEMKKLKINFLDMSFFIILIEGRYQQSNKIIFNWKLSDDNNSNLQNKSTQNSSKVFLLSSCLIDVKCTYTEIKIKLVKLKFQIFETG